MQMKTCKLVCKNPKIKMQKVQEDEQKIHNYFIQNFKVCRKEPLECDASNLTLIFHGG
jgi:hypothetical protein